MQHLKAGQQPMILNFMTNQLTDQPTNQPTNQLTNQRVDVIVCHAMKHCCYCFKQFNLKQPQATSSQLHACIAQG